MDTLHWNALITISKFHKKWEFFFVVFLLPPKNVQSQPKNGSMKFIEWKLRWKWLCGVVCVYVSFHSIFNEPSIFNCAFSFLRDIKKLILYSPMHTQKIFFPIWTEKKPLFWVIQMIDDGDLQHVLVRKTF